jgi:hypothetical protein
MPHFASAPAAEREYALMEMYALVLSWLAAFPCPVVNPPSPQGLGGQARGAVTWQCLAGAAGLPALPLRLTSSSRRYAAPDLLFYPVDSLGASLSAGYRLPSANVPAQFAAATGSGLLTVLIAGGSIAGGCPADLADPCLALARRANTPLLLLYFAPSPESPPGWFFTSADPMPVVTGDAEIGSIVALLESCVEGAR